MRLSLICHPQTPCDALASLCATVSRPAAGLVQIDYDVRGTMAALVMPEETESFRISGLWETTCLEAFIRARGADFYHELNFAPSRQWASFGFSSYRDGMHDTPDVFPLAIMRRLTDEALTLSVTLSIAPMAEVAEWAFSLSAVIEEVGGRKSFWALSHPAGAPDFHHRDCFSGAIRAADPA